MTLKAICNSFSIILVALCITSCAENNRNSNQNRTPYDSFKNALHYFGSSSGSRIRCERSPLIHKDIYARSERDKLIYFYQGEDQHNINFSKTLREYADKAWLDVEAYTLDHHSLMEFPNSREASEEIITKYFGNRYNGFKTPALFLEQYDARTMIVSIGEISFMQLVDKMNRIADDRHRHY